MLCYKQNLQELPGYISRSSSWWQDDLSVTEYQLQGSSAGSHPSSMFHPFNPRTPLDGGARGQGRLPAAPCSWTRDYAWQGRHSLSRVCTWQHTVLVINGVWTLLFQGSNYGSLPAISILMLSRLPRLSPPWLS